MTPNRVFRTVLFIAGLVGGEVQWVTAAEEASYTGFDTTAFETTLNEIPEPDSDVERVTELQELQRLLDDYKRRAESDVIVAELNENARRWRVLSKQLDDELAEVRRQAHADAELRAVASFLDLVTVTASTYDLLFRNPATFPTTSPVGTVPDPDTASGQSSQTNGDVPHQEKHVIRVRMDGEWQIVSIKGILFREPGRPESENPILRNMLGRISQWADELPSLACDTRQGACSAIASYSRPPGSAEPTRSPGSRQQPTDTEKNVFNTIMSFGIDLTPVGDGWKLVTGKDPLSGKQASRVGAGVWLVVGAVSGPLGKGVLKSARNLWKLGLHKSGAKWGRQFSKRGWTPELVDEAVLKGRQTKAENYVNPMNSATRYEYGKRSVVLDDKTRELLHVGEEGFSYERVR